MSATCAAALSCTVYDSSLLVNGTSDIGGGGAKASAGNSGATSEGGEASEAGGMPAVNAGSSGEQESGGNGGDAGDGDPPDEGGRGGTGGSGAGTAGKAGGTSGSGGKTGGAGKGGGGSGGTAGVAGAGSAGAGAGGAASAQGCAKLSVPLDDAADKAHYVITLDSTADLSGGSISMRFYVSAGAGGTIFNYVQDNSPHFFGVPKAKRLPLSGSHGWVTTTWNVGSEPDSEGTGISKTSVKRIGIEFNASPSTAWTSPAVVYIDSITVATTTSTTVFSLDTKATVSSLSTGSNSEVTGQLLWLNSGSSDTTATGSTLAWQATCP